MIDEDAGAGRRWPSRWASPTRWAPSPNGCIGAGDAGFFCKYVTELPGRGRVPDDQINRGGYTIKTTLDRNVMEKMKASLNAEVPADAAERRRT